MIQLHEGVQQLVVHFDGFTPDLEFDDYLSALTAHVNARTHPMVTIFEMSRARPTSRQRRRQAEWLVENIDAVERFSIGTAFVACSAVVRGALTAILWVRPLRHPHVFLGTLAEAEIWAEARLREAGLAA